MTNNSFLCSHINSLIRSKLNFFLFSHLQMFHSQDRLLRQFLKCGKVRFTSLPSVTHIETDSNHVLQKHNLLCWILRDFVTDKFQEDKCLESFFGGINAVRTNARRHFLVGQMPGVIFWSDICQEDKCLEAIFDRTNARRTNAWRLFFGRTNARRTNALSDFLVGQMPGGQMPGVIFWSDKCQEDKCQESLFGRTNARRTNAWRQFFIGQMPGGQMPGVNFWSDKCQEDKCLNPHLVRTNAWTHTDPGRGGGQMPRRTNAWRTNASMDKCQYRHLSYKAFVFRGICLLTGVAMQLCEIYTWLDLNNTIRSKTSAGPFLCESSCSLFVSKSITWQQL